MAGEMSSKDEAVEQESPTFMSSKEKIKFIKFIKGNVFMVVTNFSGECIGYITRDENATTAGGYLVDVIAKDSVPSLENEENKTQTPAKKR
jgi:hypothetical protein